MIQLFLSQSCRISPNDSLFGDPHLVDYLSDDIPLSFEGLHFEIQHGRDGQMIEHNW